MGGAILREADLRYAELKGCNLENAILDKAKVLKKDIKTLHECGADVSKVIAYDE
ncbi:MAG: pentapeptide repeat-containing protein [Eggerthella lenta]